MPRYRKLEEKESHQRHVNECCDQAQPAQHSPSVSDCVDALGFGRFQWFVMSVCGVFQGADAMEMMLLSYLGPCVRCEWGLSPEEEAALTTVVFCGMMIGAYIWGSLADRHGRRRTLLVLCTLTFVFGLLSAFAVNQLMLLAMRGGLGFCVGGFGVAFTYFLEWTPTNGRGFYSILFQLWWVVGVLFEAGLAWIVLPRLGWRWLVGISALPLLVVIAALYALPESPRYLVVVGRADEANAVLRRAAGLNNKASLEPMQPALSGEAIKSTTLLSVLRELFSPSLRTGTLLLWWIWFVNAFAYYGVVLMTTAVQGHSVSSDNATDAHALDCDIGGKNLPFENQDFREVFITSSSEIPGTVIAVLIVDCLGRKKSQLLLFLAAAGAFLAMTGLGSVDVAEMAMLFLARCTIAGAFLITYVYTPEIYPTRIRTTAFGAASSFARIGGMLCPFVGEDLLERNMQQAAEIIFGCVCFAAAVAAGLLPVETAGVQLSDSSLLPGDAAAAGLKPPKQSVELPSRDPESAAAPHSESAGNNEDSDQRSLHVTQDQPTLI